MSEDVGALLQQLRSLQSKVVDALQQEYFCDDVTPPDACWGWDDQALRDFFESGGEKLPSTAAAAAAPPAVQNAAPAAAAGPDRAIVELLNDAGLAHLADVLQSLTWDDAVAKYEEGRPKMMSFLKELGVSKLSERTTLTTAFGKAKKKDEVVVGQPGGGLRQPEPFTLEPLADRTDGVPLPTLSQDVKKYQEAALSAGLPDRKAGLFPPADKLLERLAADLKPFTKNLPRPCASGGSVFAVAEGGWCSGEGACEHGMDLRMFIEPGLERQYLECVPPHPRATHAASVPCALATAGCGACASAISAPPPRQALRPAASSSTRARLRAACSRG